MTDLKSIISVFSLIIVISTSCSDETIKANEPGQNAITTESLKILNKSVKDFAAKVYNDNDFKAYVAENIEYAKKFNFSANRQIINSFSTNQELEEWALHNISKTLFKSQNDFHNSQQNIRRLQNIISSKFQSEIESFQTASNFMDEFQTEITLITEANNIKKDLNETEDCLTSGTRCINRTRNNAAAGIAVSAISAVFNPIVGAAAATYTYFQLLNALEACSDAFDACMNT